MSNMNPDGEDIVRNSDQIRAAETPELSPHVGVTDFSVEEDLEGKTDKSFSQGQLVLRRFLRHRAAMASLIVLLFVIVLSITSIGVGPIPGWWKWGIEIPAPVQNGGAPTLKLWPFQIGDHPFGQDTIGKDYFALVMSGTQKSLVIAFIVGAIATVIGTTVGAVAGYMRGPMEALLMRTTDMFIILPALVLAAVLGQMSSSIGDGGIVVLAIMLGVISWTGLARLVRGEVLSLREREFVMAARAIGTPAPRIIFRHILPNTIGTIIVNATLLISAAILTESGLSFLGFGVRPPDTSLGLLISNYQSAFTTRPWLFWWPGMVILAIALSVNFIGDGLRDAFDPRQKRD